MQMVVHFRVKEMHNTDRHGCGLKNTTPLAADDLKPGKDEDMLMFLLHLYHLLKAGRKDASRYYWTLTFDEDTYNRARKIIYYVCVVAPSCGKFDSMNLPDFGCFILVPEFWHVSYVNLRNLSMGPKLLKGASDEDFKRFYYTNMTKPLLITMRNRGQLPEELAEALKVVGIEHVPNDKVINLNKEKMSAEFRDCHLYLTYGRIAFEEYR